MYDKPIYKCPHCEALVREPLEDGARFTCHVCGRRYAVMLDAETGQAAFIPLSVRPVPDPLYLPQGSIRALVTMVMSVTCWTLILLHRDVPDYLLGLLLAIIAYYFGFRKSLDAARSHILDAAGTANRPLFLPGHFIRFFLIAGFGLTGFVLHSRGLMGHPKYLEFYFILAGLVAGFLFGAIFSKSEGTWFHELISHAKGVIVLAAAAGLTALAFSGNEPSSRHVPLVLAGIISFYFGARK